MKWIPFLTPVKSLDFKDTEKCEKCLNTRRRYLREADLEHVKKPRA